MDPELQSTAEHQSFEAEIGKLRLQRTRYRTERDKAQSEVALLQGRLDDAQDKISDLEGALERALEAATPRRIGTIRQAKPIQPEVVSTPPQSDIVKAYETPYAAGDDEVEYVGSSTSVWPSSGIRHVPTTPLRHSPLSVDYKRTSRRVPYISISPRTYPIKRGRGSGESIETSSVSSSEDVRSEKRRKVEGFAALISTPSKNAPKESSEAPTSATTSTPPKEVPPSTAAISKNTSSRTETRINQDVPVASSSEVKLSDSPNSVVKFPLQPKVEIKPGTKPKTSMVPPSLVSGYLGICKSFDIVPSPSPLCVPRQFLSQMYGGSNQQLLQYISAPRNPAGPEERRIVFPTSDVNPAMPSTPGEPGLLFISRDEILKNPPWTLFHKNLAEKKAVWRYLGEYEGELRGKMSVELFRNQLPVMKQAWGELIMNKKKSDVYVEMRARVALRKAGLPLSVKNVENEAHEIKTQKTRGRPRPVNLTDIIAALESGEETIDVVKMQCVSYDRVFAQDMETKFQVWGSPAACAQRKADRLANLKLKNKGEKRAVGGKNSDAHTRTPWRKPSDRHNLSEGDDGLYAGQPSLSRVGPPRRMSMRNRVPVRATPDRDTEEEDSASSWDSDLTSLFDYDDD